MDLPAQPTAPRFARALAIELGGEFAAGRLALLRWGLPAAAVLLALGERGAVPAPLVLAAARCHLIALVTIAGIGGALQARAARDRGDNRPGVALAARLILTGVALIALHLLMRALDMPALPHPVSTTLALVVSASATAALGLLIGHALADPTRTRRGHQDLFALLFLLVLLPAAFPMLAPGNWAEAAIQTALTGTGTRAAASPLIALAALGLAAHLALRWPRARWPLITLGLAWAGTGLLVWQRPAPPPPRADLAIARLSPLPPATGRIAPMATSAPDPAAASALASIKRQISSWAPAAVADPSQRARNLLLIAAVPDLYDTEPLQSQLPALVQAELQARIPAAQLPAILAAIAAHPEQGDVAARASLPQLGLPASSGSEAPVRNRMALYAARLAARLAGQP